MNKLLLTILILLGVVGGAYAQGAGTAASIYRSSYANLGTPADGSVRYCTNCNANTTPCTSGGTGAMASRVNGAWSCSTTSASGSGTVTSVTGTANQIDVATGTTTPALSFPANGIIANNVSPGLLSTATAAGTTTLTVASKGIQVFTGSTTQTVTLPVVSTLPQVGFGYVIQNDSSGALTVNSSGGNLVQTMAANTRATFICKLLTGTSAASWNVTYLPASFGITNSAGANVVPISDGANLNGGDANTQITANTSTDTIKLQAGATTPYIQLVDGGGGANIELVVANGRRIEILTVGQAELSVGDGLNYTIEANSGLSTFGAGDTNGLGNNTQLIVNDSTQTIHLLAAGAVKLGNGPISPSSAGAIPAGTAELPFSSAFIGNAANNSSQITGTFTGNHVATLQDSSGTFAWLTGNPSFSSATYATATNCSDSAGAAACGSAAAGSVVIDAATTSVVVNTTAVTANSQIFIQEDSSLSTRLSVTCNTTIARAYVVTARTAATSFTITTNAAPVTNPACLSYKIVN